MNTETTIPATINRFGFEYVFQAVIENDKVLETTKANWKKAGHNTLVIKGNRLYATQQRVRNF